MGLAAIAVMSSGCQAMVNAKLRRDSTQSWESTRVRLGIRKEAPDISSITSYQSRDPELQLFLSYLGALSTGAKSLGGKDMDATDFEDLLRRSEDGIRKTYAGLTTMSADQKLAMAEKMTDGVRKAGPPKLLKTVPAGADPRASILSSQLAAYPDENADTLNQKYTTVLVSYKFETLEAMTHKGQELADKLRLAIAGQQGWTIMDMATFKTQAYDQRSLKGASASPEFKRKFGEQIEQQMKMYQAGLLSMKYSYESRYRVTSSTMIIPALDGYHIGVSPSLEPYNGYYELGVVLSNSITEPRKAL